MKHPISAALVVCVFALAQCGDDPVDTARQQEQARRDSLERVQAQRQSELATVTEPDAEAPATQTVDLTSIRYSDTGGFAVQVGSWRSETKAERLVQVWKSRGFDAAFMEEYGNRDTGDVWFRVRLGRIASRAQADGLSMHVRNRYKVQSWVATY